MFGSYQPQAGGGHGAPRRNFGEAVAVCLWKFLKFSGRASRSEYWYFMLFVVLVYAGASVLDVTSQSTGIITDVAMLVLLFPQLSVTWRRLHDTDHSGWWAGILFLTPVALMIGTVAVVVSGMRPPAWASGDPSSLAFDVLGAVGLVYLLTVLFFTLQRGVDRPTRFG